MSRSEKTRIGIAMARSRGVAWGRHGEVQADRNRQDAQEFALSLRPVLLGLMKGGRLGPRRLARKLNERGIPARNGGQWYPATTDRLLKRLGPAFKEEQRKLMDATYYDAFGGGRNDDAGDRRRAGPLNGPPLRRS